MDTDRILEMMPKLVETELSTKVFTEKTLVALSDAVDGRIDDKIDEAIAGNDDVRVFVDWEDGDDESGDGSRERPFKTLQAAAAYVNKAVIPAGSSGNAYVSLVSDYEFDITTDSPITFTNPDLVIGNRKLYLQGYDKSANAFSRRTFRLKNVTVSNSTAQYADTVIRPYCNLCVKYIDFVGVPEDGHSVQDYPTNNTEGGLRNTILLRGDNRLA